MTIHFFAGYIASRVPESMERREHWTNHYSSDKVSKKNPNDLSNYYDLWDKLSNYYEIVDKLSNDYDILDKLSNDYDVLDKLSKYFDILDKLL